jgi:glyoxalase family protein
MHGIHHITAIAGDPGTNLDFYTHGLGLRLVKKTVNFDDPGTYHFYFGDEQGRPGTILTFFPWEHAAPGHQGTGLTQTTAFRVPRPALEFWTQRLSQRHIRPEPVTERFGEKILTFSDPHGMSLALVGVEGVETEAAWDDQGGLPPEHAIRGFHSATLMLNEAAPTGAILTDVLGFKEIGREGAYVRFQSDSSTGSIVDVHEVKGSPLGRMGRGSVHHVAFRAANDAEQAQMARQLAQNHRLPTTEQKDRNYFRSVYFREPGGIIFEIATDDPGFTVDEPLAGLGQELKLPDFLEQRRAELETTLPPVNGAA